MRKLTPVVLIAIGALGLGACGNTPFAGPGFPTLHQVDTDALIAFSAHNNIPFTKVKSDTATCNYTEKDMNESGYTFDCTVWSMTKVALATGEAILQAGANKTHYAFGFIWTDK